MLFFNKQYPYSVMDDTITVKELAEYCEENGIYIDSTQMMNQWAMYTHYYSREVMGFNPIKSGSCAYMITTFICGMGVSCSTEMYYKEEDIEYEIFKELNTMRQEYDDDVLFIKAIFKHVTDFYLTRADKYEKQFKSTNIKLTFSEYENIVDNPGENYSEKIRLNANKIFILSRILSCEFCSKELIREIIELECSSGFEFKTEVVRLIFEECARDDFEDHVFAFKKYLPQEFVRVIDEKL